jgi:hypothetical protein
LDLCLDRLAKRGINGCVFKGVSIGPPSVVAPPLRKVDVSEFDVHEERGRVERHGLPQQSFCRRPVGLIGENLRERFLIEASRENRAAGAGPAKNHQISESLSRSGPSERRIVPEWIRPQKARVNDDSAVKRGRFEPGFVSFPVLAQPVDAARLFFDLAWASL